MVNLKALEGITVGLDLVAQRQIKEGYLISLPSQVLTTLSTLFHFHQLGFIVSLPLVKADPQRKPPRDVKKSLFPGDFWTVV